MVYHDSECNPLPATRRSGSLESCNAVVVEADFHTQSLLTKRKSLPSWQNEYLQMFASSVVDSDIQRESFLAKSRSWSFACSAVALRSGIETRVGLYRRRSPMTRDPALTLYTLSIPRFFLECGASAASTATAAAHTSVWRISRDTAHSYPLTHLCLPYITTKKITVNYRMSNGVSVLELLRLRWDHLHSNIPAVVAVNEPCHTSCL